MFSGLAQTGKALGHQHEQHFLALCVQLYVFVILVVIVCIQRVVEGSEQACWSEASFLGWRRWGGHP